VEVLDDVAVEDPSGEVQAVQTKSAAKTNPISNRSVELWKTINNWITAVRDGELKVESTTFNLHLGRERRGPIAESFRNASTANSVGAAVDKARAEFFTPKGNKLRAGIPEELGAILKVVFASENSKILQGIVTRFDLSFGAAYAYGELLDRLKTKFIDEDVAEDVLLHALGWVKKEIDNAIELDKPAVVSADKFRIELNAFRTRLKSRNYLPSFAGEPSLEQIELQKLRVFVRQLNLIESSDDQVLRAIADFLSARTDRVKWAEKGYVHSESLVEFENALRSLWLSHRDEVELDTGEDEIVRGRRLMLRCLLEHLTLQGMPVMPAFVCGCFHSLADKPLIGWHPRYEALLKIDQVSHE